jgi:hypothetical protein
MLASSIPFENQRSERKEGRKRASKKPRKKPRKRERQSDRAKERWRRKAAPFGEGESGEKAKLSVR